MTLTDKRSGAGAVASARLFELQGQRSLDDLIVAVSQNLALRGNAHCIVCGATLVRAGEGTGARAECAVCGTRLE